MKIYRYRSVSAFTYDEIESGQVWYSKLSELNDPFEGFYVNHSSDKSLDSLLQTLAVCCFSKAPDCLLMWAHYADCHRGVCLEYEISDEDFRTTFMAVQYEESMPSIDKVERYPADHKSAGHLFVNIDKKGKIFTTKSLQWQYEQEVRTFRINSDPMAKGARSKLQGNLSAVLFGIRSSETDIRIINKILSTSPAIKFHKARLRNLSYEIEFHELDRTKI